MRLAEAGWLLPSAPGRCGVCTALGRQLAPSCPCEGTQTPGASVPTLSSRKRARLRGGRLSAGAVGAQKAWTVSVPERRRAERRQSRPKEGRRAGSRQAVAGESSAVDRGWACTAVRGQGSSCFRKDCASLGVEEARRGTEVAGDGAEDVRGLWGSGLKLF